MNTEQPDTEKPGDGQASPQSNAQTNAEQEAQKEQKARQPRLRELLAIPERDRTDAVWDEIIELEISLAPGNRASGPQGEGGRRHEQGRGPQPPGGGRPGRGGFKKSRRRR